MRDFPLDRFSFARLAQIVGRKGQVSVDLTNDQLVVHDGVTKGGVPMINANGVATLTNKSISLATNTVTGTTAAFNAALSDGDFATLAGTETLTNKTLTDPKISGSITLPKTSGEGLKVNTTTPAFGWRDLTASVEVRGVGANDPTFITYTGTTLRAFSFSAGTMNEAFFVFHVPHDWVPGTDIFIHAHWSNAAATPNTGDVVWKFDYSFAKGFGQEAFPAVTTVEVIAACPATRYLHNVSETDAVTIPTMEVDGLILLRGYRDAANVLDTCSDAVFLHTIDIHYQSTNMATANKAPSFYA
jgi:hypothetical protein